MADGSTILRKKTVEELKSDALAELERLGYDVRGKTPTQIRQILKRRPTKPKSITAEPSDALQSPAFVDSAGASKFKD